jgi:hypothetical protein
VCACLSGKATTPPASRLARRCEPPALRSASLSSGTPPDNTLTALLHDDITVAVTAAVEILRAAKAGNTAAFSSANNRWYANGQ